MIFFAVRRLAAGAVLLVVISALTYALLFFSGQSIARNILGDMATDEQVALKEAELGLDQPLPVRFVVWAGSALTGDLGGSWFTARNVADAIFSRLPVTLALVFVSIVLVAVIATLLGMAAAIEARVGRPRRAGRRGGRRRASPGSSSRSSSSRCSPCSCGSSRRSARSPRGRPSTPGSRSLTLPVIAIVVNYVTSSAQQIRSAVITQLERDYVRTLRSRGIGEGEILFKHVLRSAAPAGLTVIGLQFVGLLGGVVIIEQVFAVPGIGALAVDATTSGDIPIVMGVVVYTVIIVVIVNLLIDLANGWLNPKVRVG